MDKGRDSQKIMTVQDVSRYLRIPVSTIYELAAKGKIRGVKFGKHWRFLEEDILKYLHGEHPSLENHEKRIYPRLNTELDSDLINLLPSSNLSRIKSKIINLSEGGVFIAPDKNEFEKMLEAFNTGDPVKIILPLPAIETEPIEVEGRIVHRRVIGKSGFGVKFRNLEKSNQKVIREYVG